MDPKVTKLVENDGIIEFTIDSINVSYVNGIRRTILSEIPVNAFITETYEENKCNIMKNTSRFHNEIVKQRLSCIPICETELSRLPGKYRLEVHKKNETNNISYCTSEDFKIKNLETNTYMEQEEVKKIFPPDEFTGDYISFIRLRPSISESIQGEEIKLECDFSTSNAKNNSMYNVVSLCSFGNTIDINKAEKKWESIEKKMRSDGMIEDEIIFEKKNFYILDAQREYKENSFDFSVKSIGIYNNKQLLQISISLLIEKLTKFIEDVDGDLLPVNIGNSTMENCYDIKLLDEDYTLGKIIEHELYNKYFETDKNMSFVGFKKFHPHDTESVMRVAYIDNVEKNTIRQHLKTVANICIDKYTKVGSFFK